mgnify:CR=1 FL=1
MKRDVVKTLTDKDNVVIQVVKRVSKTTNKEFYDLVVNINDRDFVVFPKSFYTSKANSLYIHLVKSLVGLE